MTCVTYSEAVKSNRLQAWADCAGNGGDHLSGWFWGWLAIYIVVLLGGGWIAYRDMTTSRAIGWLLWVIGGSGVLFLLRG